MAISGQLTFEKGRADAARLRARLSVIVTGDKPAAPTLLFSRHKPTGQVLVGVLRILESGDAGAGLRVGGDSVKTVEYAPSGEAEVGPLGSRWMIYLEVEAGSAVLIVTVKDLAKQIVWERLGVLPSQVNASTPQKQTLKASGFPRLSLALNGAPVAEPPKPGPIDLGGAAPIKVLLDHVYSRLVTPDSKDDRADALLPAWRHAEAPFGVIPKQLSGNNKRAQAEEAWARQITEMITLTPYAGPGITHFGSDKFDRELIAEPYLGTGSNRCYSLTYACQHLTSATLASRNVPNLKLVNAGSATAQSVVDMGGKWVIGDSQPRVVDPGPPSTLACTAEFERAPALFKITEQSLGGCTFAAPAPFVYANRPVKAAGKFTPENAKKKENGTMPEGEVKHEGGMENTYVDNRLKESWAIGEGGLLRDNTAGAHIGPILRVDPTQKLFQVLDTGGLGGNSDGHNFFGTTGGFHTGNFDYPATTFMNGKDPPRGVGVFPPMPESDAQKLSDHVENVLKKARPLGFARFILVPRSANITFKNFTRVREDGLVLYASPLLRMYDDPEAQNYAIARYAWSLRQAPGRDSVRPMWVIYSAIGVLARAMINAPRTERPAALAQRALGLMKNPTKFLRRNKTASDPDGADVQKILAEYTFPLLILATRADGTVEAPYKYKNTSPPPWPPLLYAARPAWDKSIKMPMDKVFLHGKETDSSFPAYFRNP